MEFYDIYAYELELFGYLFGWTYFLFFFAAPTFMFIFGALIEHWDDNDKCFNYTVPGQLSWFPADDLEWLQWTLFISSGVGFTAAMIGGMVPVALLSLFAVVSVMCGILFVFGFLVDITGRAIVKRLKRPIMVMRTLEGSNKPSEDKNDSFRP